ncbi:EAL domain-containing protein [Micromonospora sp. NPDC049559]|uniref:putative bifunctional diguanylate cyclase/phosphodiesterase n=1 Tax=Micromonospora sp. NPDC049559 TaxID=3155923 RepID=UPI003425D165
MVLTVAVLGLALAAILAGLALPTVALPPDDPLPPLARFGAAAGLAALAHLARLRFRVGSGIVNVSWGEAAFVIGLYLAPAGWLPAAVFLGGALAWGLLSVFSERRGVLDVVYNAALLTVAVAVATSVVVPLSRPFDAAPTPVLAGALVLGSLAYLLVTVGLTALTLSLRHGLPLGPLLLRTVRGKLLMFVGNVLVGLVTVTMLGLDPRWLLLLPPALWLLQQTYSHRLRADDERRTWRAFAEATRALNQLDERSVATAGVGGARTLFRAESVEVDVVRPDGRRRRYRGDATGEVTERDLPPHPEPAPEPDGTENELSRSLMVGAAHVGELRVRFPRTAQPGEREHDALSAFGDALGAALHDAATHQELRIVTARSSYEAVHDPLTNLVNRAAMLSKGDHALHQLGHDHPVALLLLDLNHFKEVNDTLGHAAGDELLQITAARLGALARPDELLGRLGGDEFALLMTSVPVLGESAVPGERPPPLPHALRRAREIVDRLAAPAEVAGVRMSVEVSVGVVVAGAGTADMTELLRRADIAMYQAKEGGGSVAAYDSARDAASTDQLALLAELREALDADDQLVLALQPAVDLATGAPTGVEALIRWHHPRRGWLTPADFVRPIEGSELLGSFTRYVVDKALAVAAEWARHGLDVPISINLSARSLLDPRLPAEVAESLRRHHVPADRLVLEITETVVMSELEVIDEVLAALRSLGVQLAVDDFGTGFSSLTFLTRIAVDELKVDRSFVMRMADSPEAAAIVRTTVDLGRELGLRVVAEGVETADQRAALAELGCTAAQGYHFFKPMPSDKIVTVLSALSNSAQSARILPLRADGVS